MKTVLLSCLLWLSCISVYAVDVVFRFDDFRLHSDSLQDQLLETFYYNEIPISLAVVPCSNDTLYLEGGSYLAMLRSMNSDGMAEIALHGLNHRRVAENGEFAGVALEKQIEMISKGKHYLDSLFSSTVTFIPPWNSYDDNTLKALEYLDVECISSCMTIGQPLTSERLAYFPETIDHPSKLLKAIDDNRNRRGVIVLMFHHYDFDQEFTIQDLDVLLKSLKNMDNVNCYTFKMLCNRNIKSDKGRFLANLEINLLSKTLKTGQMLQTKSFAVMIRICNLLIYLCIVLAVAIVGRLVFGLNGYRFWIGWGIVLIISGILVWWHILGPLKALLMIVAFSIVYLLVVSVICRRKIQK